jgi:hypothetical protein
VFPLVGIFKRGERVVGQKVSVTTQEKTASIIEQRDIYVESEQRRDQRETMRKEAFPKALTRRSLR